MVTIKRLTLVLVLALGPLALPAHSQSLQVPDQKITGADSIVPLGDIVVLGVTPLSGVAPTGTSYTWEVLDPAMEWKSFRDLPDGGIVFGSGITPKTFKVFCAATYLFVTKDGEKVTDISTKTVILHADVKVGGGPSPPPNPTPGPSPPPTPLPDGKFGLARKVFDLSPKIPPDIRLKAAKAFAQNYKGVASAIAAGGVVGQNAALKETTVLNNASAKSLGFDRDQVLEFFTQLQAVVYGMAVKQAEKPGDGLVWEWTDNDFRLAWLEIAAGLEAVQ